MFPLQDLNDHLQTTTFLVGDMISVADYSVFLAIASIVQSLSLNEKERLMHLSRWYNSMQNQSKIQTKKAYVNFSTLRLSAFEHSSRVH